MKLLILGYSNIVQKKALKGISQVDSIEKIDIASQSRFEEAKKDPLINGEVYSDYDVALSETEAELVYVSTVNSFHFVLAKKALLAGKHVVVDKPSFMHESELKEIIEIAKEKNLFVSEAIIYGYHPQFQKTKEIFEQSGAPVNRMSCVFSFPPFPNEDGYQYIPEFGGGAVYDLGPYALTPGRIFFGTDPKEIKAVVTHRHENDLNTSFSIMAVYPGNKVFVGHFGFNSAYKSHLTLIGKNAVVDMPVPFSPPSTLENELSINVNNERDTIKVEAKDNFEAYFAAIVDDLSAGKVEEHRNRLFTDFKALEMLKKSISL